MITRKVRFNEREESGEEKKVKKRIKSYAQASPARAAVYMYNYFRWCFMLHMEERRTQANPRLSLRNTSIFLSLLYRCWSCSRLTGKFFLQNQKRLSEQRFTVILFPTLMS